MILLNGSSHLRGHMKEKWALVNDPLKVSPGILSACQGVGLHTAGLQPCWVLRRGWAF